MGVTVKSLFPLLVSAVAAGMAVYSADRSAMAVYVFGFVIWFGAFIEEALRQTFQDD